MNLNCDIAMDLVSLYKDGLASEKSREAVKEHLAECPDCRRYYREYNKIDHIKLPVTEPSAPSDIMKRYAEISLKLRRKRNWYAGLIAVSACVAVAALIFSLFYKKPCPRT